MNMTTSPAPYLIEARNISKHFGTVVALDRVNLRVPSATVVALLGDNGAGKSTLIKILSGVIQPDSGELFWENVPIALRSAREAMGLGISVATFILPNLITT